MLLKFLIVALAAAVLAAGLALWRRARHQRQRENRLRDLLDLADALENQLNRAERRMAVVRGTVNQLAGDLSDQVPLPTDPAPLVREAKRDLLQHRLWIQKEGLAADLPAIEHACEALRRVSGRIGQRLAALDSASADLDEATDAAQQSARREPPELRRPSPPAPHDE